MIIEDTLSKNMTVVPPPYYYDMSHHNILSHGSLRTPYNIADLIFDDPTNALLICSYAGFDKGIFTEGLCEMTANYPFVMWHPSWE